ncbi:Dps family protein [Bifidobacterium choloepi]|uniref:DNA starvation/stationary phase protection protein n=1 Tax=Bifidobacterium choloepi TaxID=2614131 RepID=A0A6I5N0B2_9BIFI|nr:DNA starvation/stationary phase protection protein [Bifidobacterium choloepi]NEG70007.1 DNA starvation/stationary phase protection protein [Bifidobacterium choloepi]
MALEFVIPGLDAATDEKIIPIMQECLSHEQEAALVLKHAHWNVAGPNFIGVHEMIDPQVDDVLNMADESAERISQLGGSPLGRPEDIVRFRTWPEFKLEGRQNALDYLRALDKYYDDFIKGERTAIKELDELDVISSNIIQDHVQNLEKFQWFMRSFLIH